MFSDWVLAGNEESLRSLEMVWLFDGLAMEDMIGEVREKLGGCFLLILS
jgi:hypothetical protein